MAKADSRNRGPLTQFITGITGILPGGNGVVNFNTNQRYHEFTFRCKAGSGAYAGTPTTVTAATAGGTAGTYDLTYVLGKVATVTITTAGTGQTDGIYIQRVDQDGGKGAIFRITVVGGLITAIEIAAQGAGGWIEPGIMLTSFRLIVNGVVMRDIPPITSLNIVKANGIVPQPGEFPVFFTEPWRKIFIHNVANSWDMAGQGTFTAQIGIASAALIDNPQFDGVETFDYQQNTQNVQQGNKTIQVPFLQPIAHRQFTQAIVGGLNTINTIPFTYPLLRMWMNASVPGSLSKLEVYQDNQKIEEMYTEQQEQVFSQYGFAFNPLGNQFQSGKIGKPFDMAFISDLDERYEKALVGQTLELRVYSDIAQALAITCETLPGGYRS